MDQLLVIPLCRSKTQNVSSIEARDTELGFSESDGCHPSHTCSPTPEVNPKRDAILRTKALWYTPGDTSDTQKDFCR